MAQSPRHPERPPADPAVPDEVTWHDLDREARAGLRSLPKEMAERVGAHLAMAGLLVDEDPEAARAHAAVARRLGSRVAVVREAMGLTLYACGDYEGALAELRAYRRMSGDQTHLPLMADCERGLGRPARALELAGEVRNERLPADVRRELVVVTAGARNDLGQHDAALLLLERELSGTPTGDPASTLRLRYACADTLERLGRRSEAATLFAQVADADVDGLTDAAERAQGIASDGSERV